MEQAVIEFLVSQFQNEGMNVPYRDLMKLAKIRKKNNFSDPVQKQCGDR